MAQQPISKNDEEENEVCIPCWMFDEAQISTTPKHEITNHLSYTNETVVKRIYNLARILHDTLTKSGISYWASSGTLLGCVRHGGFIPWDDDLDLCVYQKDTEKIEQCLKTLLNDNGCEIVEVPVFGYRVFHKTESEKLPSEYQKHRYPFCDIFVMKRKHNITWVAKGSGRTRWPEEYYHNKDIDNMESKLFGDVYLNCTANAEEYLERNYGEHWYTQGATHNYDHIKQEFVNSVKFKLKPEHYEPAKPYR